MDLLCFVYFPLTLTKSWLHVWFTVWGLSAYQFCIRFDQIHIWEVRILLQLYQQRILVSMFLEFETQWWKCIFKSWFKWLWWFKTQQVSDTMLTVITSHQTKYETETDRDMRTKASKHNRWAKRPAFFLLTRGGNRNAAIQLCPGNWCDLSDLKQLLVLAWHLSFSPQKNP